MLRCLYIMYGILFLEGVLGRWPALMCRGWGQPQLVLCVCVCVLTCIST